MILFYNLVVAVTGRFHGYLGQKVKASLGPMTKECDTLVKTDWSVFYISSWSGSKKSSSVFVLDQETQTILSCTENPQIRGLDPWDFTRMYFHLMTDFPLVVYI